MLTRNVRASDTVARLGGDEFGLILWNLSEADAAAKAWALEAADRRGRVEWEGERSRSAPRSVLRCWGRPTNSPT